MSRVLNMNIGRCCRINDPENELQEDVHRIKRLVREPGKDFYLLESIETCYVPRDPTIVSVNGITMLDN